MGERMHYFYASARVAFLAYFCTATQKEVPILILNYMIESIHIIYCWNSGEVYFQFVIKSR